MIHARYGFHLIIISIACRKFVEVPPDLHEYRTQCHLLRRISARLCSMSHQY